MILVKSQNLKYLAAVIFGLSTISIAAFAIFNQKGGSHAGKIAHKNLKLRIMVESSISSRKVQLSDCSNLRKSCLPLRSSR